MGCCANLGSSIATLGIPVGRPIAIPAGIPIGEGSIHIGIPIGIGDSGKGRCVIGDGGIGVCKGGIAAMACCTPPLGIAVGILIIGIDDPGNDISNRSAASAPGGHGIAGGIPGEAPDIFAIPWSKGCTGGASCKQAACATCCAPCEGAGIA